MVVHTRMTASEYMALLETSQPMMLLDGEIIVSLSATFAHQVVIIALIKLLLRITKDGMVLCVPLDIHFDEFNVTQPDVLWIAPGGKCHRTEDGKFLTGAPDFIAEILSPSTAGIDRTKKFVLYEKYGVRESWLVDPEVKQIEVWSLQEGKFGRVGLFGPGKGFTSPLFGVIAGNAIFVETAE